MQELSLGTIIKHRDAGHLRGVPVLEKWVNTYILGAPRAGKTNFMKYLAGWQSLDCAIIVIDPHGQLSPYLAHVLDKKRLIYADVNNPFVINPLSRDYDITDISSEFIGAINACVQAHTRNQHDITVKMARALNNALAVFKPKHMTIGYLIQFLENYKVRQVHMGADRPSYWEVFDNTRDGRELRESASRLVDRLDIVFANKYAKRFIEGQDQFNLKEIIRDKKILLFNFEGMPYESKAYIGSLITYGIRTYLNMAPESPKEPKLGVYVDECHNFINYSFEDSLVQCDKRGITFCLAHHNLQQLVDFKSSVLIHGSPLVALFEPWEEDAAAMKQKFRGIKPEHLSNTEKYHCFVSIDGAPHYIYPTDCTGPKYIPPVIPENEPEEINFFRYGKIYLGNSSQPG